MKEEGLVVSNYRKGIAAIIAFLAAIVSAGVLDAPTAQWATAIISGLGAVAVILVPNTPAPPQ